MRLGRGIARQAFLLRARLVQTPGQISGSSNALATGSLSLTAPAGLGSLTSTATADGTLTLDPPGAVGPRAAPGWLGLFITDTSSSIPTISGGSTATATGSLSIVTPSRPLILGSSQAVATGSLTLRAGATSAAFIATPTSLSSAQFGASTLSSDQAGASVLVPDAQHQIS